MSGGIIKYQHLFSVAYDFEYHFCFFCKIPSIIILNLNLNNGSVSDIHLFVQLMSKAFNLSCI